MISDDQAWLDEVVVIALGSNLAGAFASCELLLEAALTRLSEQGFDVRARSSWWRSVAWPDPSDPPYVNGIALVATEMDPQQALKDLAALEVEFGRRRGAANAPRTLDLDLIAYGRVLISESGLEIPHPRAHARRFVMGPLAETAPGWRHPITGEMAVVLAARAGVGADAHPI